MPPKTVVFSTKAALRLAAISNYLFEKTGSQQFVLDYMARMKEYIRLILLQFPEAGREAEEYGPNIRKIVYRGYSILYRHNEPKGRIEIVNLFRENLP